MAPWETAGAPLPGFEWNPRTVRAYAEGREGILPNFHLTGSDARIAHQRGVDNAAFPTQKFETAID